MRNSLFAQRVSGSLYIKKFKIYRNEGCERATQEGTQEIEIKFLVASGEDDESQTELNYDRRCLNQGWRKEEESEPVSNPHSHYQEQ